jgi:long-chain acyl-CoA synthetase
MCGIVALIVPASCGLDNGVIDDTTYKRYADEINACLESAAHEEQIRNFAILDRPFSIERGELTPKLSLRRETIAGNFSEQLASISQPIHRTPSAPSRV